MAMLVGVFAFHAKRQSQALAELRAAIKTTECTAQAQAARPAFVITADMVSPRLVESQAAAPPDARLALGSLGLTTAG